MSERPAPSAALAAAAMREMAPFEVRLTSHRRAVLGALEAAGRPLSVEEVVAAAGVPTSTAYRNLSELVDCGVVARVVGAGGADRHELAEALSHHHHHHMVCTRCGTVSDFDPSRQLERLIGREIEQILEETGFAVDHHVFDVRGLCRRCRD